VFVEIAIIVHAETPIVSEDGSRECIISTGVVHSSGLSHDVRRALLTLYKKRVANKSSRNHRPGQQTHPAGMNRKVFFVLFAVTMLVAVASAQQCNALKRNLERSRCAGLLRVLNTKLAPGLKGDRGRRGRRGRRGPQGETGEQGAAGTNGASVAFEIKKKTLGVNVLNAIEAPSPENKVVTASCSSGKSVISIWCTSIEPYLPGSASVNVDGVASCTWRMGVIPITGERRLTVRELNPDEEAAITVVCVDNSLITPPTPPTLS